MSSRDDPGALEPNLDDPEDLADRKSLEDLDRYEPLDDLDMELEERTRRFPVVSFLIALLVSVAAGGGLWYVLGQGEDRPIPLVVADREQVKARPDQPGGLNVPHQQIEVLNQPAQETAAESAPAEVLLPPPQVQMPMPEPPPPPMVQAEPPTASPSDAAPQPTAAEAPAIAEPAVAAKTEIPPVPPLPPTPANGAPSDAGPAAAEARKLAPPPLPKTETAATPAAPPATPTEQAAVTKPPAPAASPPTASASKTYRAQVASFRDAARAESKVAAMRKAHAELFGPLPLAVRRVVLGSGKSVHRVQAGAFAERGQANALCEELKRRGEKDCFVTQ